MGREPVRLDCLTITELQPLAGADDLIRIRRQEKGHTILPHGVIRENILGPIQEQRFLPRHDQRRYDVVVEQVPHSGVAGYLGCLNRTRMVAPDVMHDFGALLITVFLGNVLHHLDQIGRQGLVDQQVDPLGKLLDVGRLDRITGDQQCTTLVTEAIAYGGINRCMSPDASSSAARPRRGSSARALKRSPNPCKYARACSMPKFTIVYSKMSSTSALAFPLNL